jgi:hypothetical protein
MVTKSVLKQPLIHTTKHRNGQLSELQIRSLSVLALQAEAKEVLLCSKYANESVLSLLERFASKSLSSASLLPTTWPSSISFTEFFVTLSQQLSPAAAEFDGHMPSMKSEDGDEDEKKTANTTDALPAQDLVLRSHPRIGPLKELLLRQLNSAEYVPRPSGLPFSAPMPAIASSSSFSALPTAPAASSSTSAVGETAHATSSTAPSSSASAPAEENKPKVTLQPPGSPMKTSAEGIHSLFPLSSLFAHIFLSTGVFSFGHVGESVLTTPLPPPSSLAEEMLAAATTSHFGLQNIHSPAPTPQQKAEFQVEREKRERERDIKSAKNERKRKRENREKEGIQQ